jgi:phosphatidylinositol 4-kinase type 2
MPKKARPTTSGYARLAQADEEEDDDLYESARDDPTKPVPTISTPNGNLQIPKRSERMQNTNRNKPFNRMRQRRNSGVDLKALNARFEKWADEIATRFKIKKASGRPDLDHLEIQHSVFQAPDWIRPATDDTLQTIYIDAPGMRMPDDEFEATVESVRIAIDMDIHPDLIAKGSSGSYFARSARQKVVGVFKPKDEEPYASKNPKWTKWIHRNLFPCFFGRACLIPNLSYVSEAAAYVLDKQLRANIVPYTDVVALSSKSFHYDYWDRRAFYRKKKPLPEKPGSFQVFLSGYQDATSFFKEHPWPDQNAPGLDELPRPRKRGWTDDCRKGRTQEDEDDDEPLSLAESNRRKTFWTDVLQQEFRKELEKLVILDYIMRNTDRGLDNWMIKIEQENSKPANGHPRSESDLPYNRPVEQMIASSRTGTPVSQNEPVPIVRIGAIDNSLSFPWKHPDEWRSYPYGWLFLPVSLIGQPFSESTRQHFLPLLTSKAWWSETQAALRSSFRRDSDFKETMFAKQLAIIKGQAWNVVETLKCPDHGPLELTRRPRVCVWDDLVEVPVAVPLTTQTSDPSHLQSPAEEEGDISHIGSSQRQASTPKASFDLVGLVSPDLERENPFNTSRQSSHLDMNEDFRVPSPTLSPPNVLAMSASLHSAGGHPGPRMPGHTRSRLSFDGSPRAHQQKDKRKQHSRRLSISAKFGAWDEGEEADLGYAANEDRDGYKRKVIVERLENVASKNPVFTCC